MYVQWEKSTYTTLKEDVNGFHCQCFFFCRHSLPVLKNLLFFLFFFLFFLFLNVPNTFIALGLSFAAICNSQIIRS